MAAKGRANGFYRNGLRSGYAEYRYGTPKKPVKLAPIFTGEKRKHRVAEVAEVLSDWKNSVFEHEADCRNGLRSGLCLVGYGWARADAEASSLVGQAFRGLGAQRPTWAEGQPEYTVPRENCSWCGADVPEEFLKDGLRIKFCSEVCAKSAYQYRTNEEARGKGELYTAARNIICRAKNDRFICQECGDPFQPVSGSGRFCSSVCAARGQRYLPDRDCRQCGISFRPKDGSKIYCSKKCADLAKRECPDRICKHCGVLFRRTNRAGSENPQFCSRKCWLDGKRVTITKDCIWCSRPFVAHNVEKVYCSSSCSNTMARLVSGRWMPQKLTMPVFDYFFTKPINRGQRRRSNIVCLPVIDRPKLTPAVFDSWFEAAA